VLRGVFTTTKPKTPKRALTGRRNTDNLQMHCAPFAQEGVQKDFAFL